MMDIRHQISRPWKQYTIMHLDRRVASIHSNGTCTIYASSSVRMEGNFAAIKPIYTRTKPRQKNK